MPSRCRGQQPFLVGQGGGDRGEDEPLEEGTQPLHHLGLVRGGQQQQRKDLDVHRVLPGGDEEPEEGGAALGQWYFDRSGGATEKSSGSLRTTSSNASLRPRLLLAQRRCPRDRVHRSGDLCC